MNLNCKQGDLAIVVRSVAGNTGKIVRCLRLAPEMGNSFRTRDGILRSCVWWLTDTPISDFLGRKDNYIPDEKLRPIRDQPGDDETLTWAGKPAPVIRKLSEPEFDAACDRWIQGVEA